MIKSVITIIFINLFIILLTSSFVQAQVGTVIDKSLMFAAIGNCPLLVSLIKKWKRKCNDGCVLVEF